MVFQFRRTLRIVPGVRVNLSKGGTSVSFGSRGFHYTVGKKGTRTTVGIPGSGLSWTTCRPYAPNKSTQTRADHHLPEEPKYPEGHNEQNDSKNVSTFESHSIDELIIHSTGEITDLLTGIRRKIRTTYIAVVIIILILSYEYISNQQNIFVATGAIGIACWICCLVIDRYRLTVKLHYELTEDQNDRFERLKDVFSQLADCGQIWRIPMQARQFD
jgi:hypothetical protein